MKMKPRRHGSYTYWLYSHLQTPPCQTASADLAAAVGHGAGAGHRGSHTGPRGRAACQCAAAGCRLGPGPMARADTAAGQSLPRDAVAAARCPAAGLSGAGPADGAGRQPPARRFCAAAVSGTDGRVRLTAGPHAESGTPGPAFERAAGLAGGHPLAALARLRRDGAGGRLLAEPAAGALFEPGAGPAGSQRAAAALCPTARTGYSGGDGARDGPGDPAADDPGRAGDDLLRHGHAGYAAEHPGLRGSHPADLGALPASDRAAVGTADAERRAAESGGVEASRPRDLLGPGWCCCWSSARPTGACSICRC